MKYKAEIDIHVPRDRLVGLFEDPDNLSSYHPGLLRFELLSGEIGQEGAVIHRVYAEDTKEVDMLETIIRQDSPTTFVRTYETNGVWKELTHRFVENGDRTRWQVDVDFRCSGWKWLVGILAPGTYKKETEEYMARFKQFAESTG